MKNINNSIFSSRDLLDGWLTTNCVSTLFHENPDSCFKTTMKRKKERKLTNKKQKKKNNNKKNKTVSFNISEFEKALREKERLSGDSAETSIYVESLERTLNTLNQYPFLCSLKTK